MCLASHQSSKMCSADANSMDITCLGSLWLAVQGKLLYRESCCAEKATVLNFTVWQLS
jgi:hypothetical protein